MTGATRVEEIATEPSPDNDARPPTRKPARTGTVDPDSAKGWIRRFLPIVRPYRWLLVASVAAAASSLAIYVAIPQVLRGAIDNSLVRGNESLTPYAVTMFGLGLGQLVLIYIQRFGLQRASVEIECGLRTTLFEHLSRQSFSFYDRVQVGELVSRANSDLRAIQLFLSFGPTLGVALLSFLATLVLMVHMHLVLTLATAVTLPFIYFTGLSMRKRLFPISWLVMARAADIATIVEENVTGVRVVKSFAAESAQLSLFERAARRMRWISVRMMDNQALFAPIMQALARLGMVVLLLFGGYLVIEGRLTLGEFLAFNSYVMMMQMPFVMIGMLMMMAQRAAASAERVLEVLDQEIEILDHPGAVDLVECSGEVEFRNVTFSYTPGVRVLRDMSLHLRPGETVALVGRTGCGKSTVARLIPRFYDVDDGAVVVDGHDVRRLTLATLRSHIGLVLDEPFLFSASLRDNIAFGRPDAPFEEVVDAAKAAGVDDFITSLPEGYDTVVGERGYTLSGGQRQRIAIARTLLVNPRILILDDATSSIDAQREHEIHGALRLLMEGRTTIVIAHRISTIGLAERVLVMEDGRIVAEGTHSELLRTSPLYVDILAHADESHAEAGPEGGPPGPIGAPAPPPSGVHGAPMAIGADAGAVAPLAEELPAPSTGGA